MSRWLVAPQEYKGTLTAVEAAAALAEGLREGAPGVELDVAPLAEDGGRAARGRGRRAGDAHGAGAARCARGGGLRAAVEAGGGCWRT